MYIYSSDLTKSARISVWESLLAGGSIDFYSGSIPSNGGTPTGGKLATVQLPTPAGSVTGGTFSITPSIETVALLSGDPTWCRVKNSSSNLLLDLDCSAANGSGAVWVSPLSIYAGGTLRLIKLKLIEP